MHPPRLSALLLLLALAPGCDSGTDATLVTFSLFDADGVHRADGVADLDGTRIEGERREGTFRLVSGDATVHDVGVGREGTASFECGGASAPCSLRLFSDFHESLTMSWDRPGLDATSGTWSSWYGIEGTFTSD